MDPLWAADVVVVGGGPGGACAALAAARSGADVLLLELRGDPACWSRACTGMVSRDVLDDTLAGLPQRVLGHIDSLRFELPNGSSCVRPVDLVLMDRPRWDADLVAAARAAGARVELGARVIRVGDALFVERDGARTALRARVVIAAHGPRAGVFGDRPRARAFASSAQVTLPTPHGRNEARILLRRGWRGGYGWVIPHGELAHVGVCFMPERGAPSARAQLGALVAELVSCGELQARDDAVIAGGALPAWGPAPSAIEGNVLFVGDAAGHCDPVTFSGIHLAAAGGLIAGELAARATREDPAGELGEYDALWKSRFGDRLTRAASARRELDEHWSGSGDLDALVRRAWPLLAGNGGRRDR